MERGFGRRCRRGGKGEIDMKSLLKALCERLRARRDHVTKEIEVRGVLYDPTYGPSSLSDIRTVVDDAMTIDAPTVLAHYYAIPALIDEVRLGKGSFHAWDRARALTHKYQGWELVEPRYACPVPAQSVPVAAIEKVLAEVMEIAVSNGASSVSMPDEYVEIAAWLHGLATVPKPEEAK